MNCFIPVAKKFFDFGDTVCFSHTLTKRCMHHYASKLYAYFTSKNVSNLQNIQEVSLRVNIPMILAVDFNSQNH